MPDRTIYGKTPLKSSFMANEWVSNTLISVIFDENLNLQLLESNIISQSE